MPDFTNIDIDAKKLVELMQIVKGVLISSPPDRGWAFAGTRAMEPAVFRK